MLGRLMFIVLPTITIVVLARYKIPDKTKIFGRTPREWFYDKALGNDISIFLIAGFCSWMIIRHTVAGVLAGPAIFMADLIIWPSFKWLKARWDKNKFQKSKKEVPVLC